MGFALRCRDRTTGHQLQRSPAINENLQTEAARLVRLAWEHKDLAAELQIENADNSRYEESAKEILSEAGRLNKIENELLNTKNKQKQRGGEKMVLNIQMQRLSNDLEEEMNGLRKKARSELGDAVIDYDKIISQQSDSSDIAAAAAAAAAKAAAEKAVETAEKNLMSAVERSNIKFNGALYIGFDTESQGFASALVRVFLRVS